jgi:molybdopterin molybdotransferase
MIDYGAAHRQVVELGASLSLGVEYVSLTDSLGRVVAEDITATEHHPRFDHSAMDGYAVRAGWTKEATPDAPLSIPTTGMVRAGDPPPSIDMGAVEIMTGAPIPVGYDAVVRVEDTTLKGGDILLPRPVDPGENIRRAGEDFTRGEVLVRCGTRIRPPHLLGLATSGISSIPVFERPRVVLLCTGNEVVPFDTSTLGPYEVRNSTAPYITSILKELGAEVRFEGIVADESEALASAFRRARSVEPHLIITQGGVSAGKFDLVPKVLCELGGAIHFHKVAIRPGKPILVGTLGRSCVVGMPGNPMSVVVALRFFVKPLLSALFRERAETPLKRRVAKTVSVPPSLLFFQRGVETDGGVMPLDGQGSGMVRSFLEAEGWIAARAVAGVLEEGSPVGWYPLE